MTRENRTARLLAQIREMGKGDMDREFDMLKAVLCMDHAVKTQDPVRKPLREVFDLMEIARRMDELCNVPEKCDPATTRYSPVSA